jgi:hypothetical protein
VAIYALGTWVTVGGVITLKLFVGTGMADKEQPGHEEREELPLSKAFQFLLEECRMVVPGIQALFGFQLIAVFNPSFAQKLSPAEQRLHLLAIALAAVGMARIMTPAAYHRQSGPRDVGETFISVSTARAALEHVAAGGAYGCGVLLDRAGDSRQRLCSAGGSGAVRASCLWWRTCEPGTLAVEPAYAPGGTV